MQDNPFSSILGTIRDDAKDRSVGAWRFGKVVSVEPLVVEMGGQNLEGKDLLVNIQLIENEEEIEMPDTTGILNGEAVEGELRSPSAIFGGVLEAGDQVVLLQPEDGQQYVVLCKVVEV